MSCRAKVRPLIVEAPLAAIDYVVAGETAAAQAKTCTVLLDNGIEINYNGTR